MDVESVSQIINSMGFPIFVAVFMLTKQNKETQQMRDTLNELKNAIHLLASVKDGDQGE